MYSRSIKVQFLFVLVAVFVLSLAASNNLCAQDTQPTSDDVVDQIEPVDSQQVEKARELEELSLAIKEKTLTLKSLRRRADKVGDSVELETDIQIVKHQLETLEKSFEQIAIGSINLDALEGDDQSKTWQEELTLVVKPLLENLRSLTERPRRRENLRQHIAAQQDVAVQADRALVSIDLLLENKPSKSQTSLLKPIRDKWLRTKEDAHRQEQLALYQLKSMSDENVDWFTSIKESLLEFFRERGLTLLLAIVVSLAIWLMLAGVRNFFDRRGKKSTKHANRTTYRVIAYAQRLLTVTLIIIAVLTVFFVRGDILLLVITLALLFASALGLKNLLPQFIAESRLLLNIGAVREHEQVVINGVPWKVASINIFSKFSNPEIHGTLRLPLAALKGMMSRPVSDEKWFPSSIGDWVLDGDRDLYEVIRQTPIVVELQSTRGTNKFVPTADYFSAGFVNLTKSKKIRITSHFGVSYELQNIALDEVPNAMQAFVQKHLENAGLETTQIDVRVEFEKAGESSLDYIIIALLGSKASRYFYRIERTIQQACVAACNEKGWEVPFPQLTIHHGGSEE